MKYTPESLKNWQKHPQIAGIVEKSLKFEPTNVALAGWLVYLAIDPSLQELTQNPQAVPMLKDLRVIVNAIDDDVDTAGTEDILKQKVHLGPEPSPFLEHILRKPERVQIFDTFIEKGMIKQPDLYSFGNVLCSLVWQEAYFAEMYKRTPHPDLRLFMAEQHFRLDGASLALYTHFLRQNPQISEGVLDYEKIAEVYPHTVLSGRAIQILDDQKDFLQDIHQEKQTGRITPNYFLALLDKAGILNSPEFQAYFHDLPHRRISFDELPSNVQEVMSTAKSSHFNDVSDMLPFTSRVTYTTFWNTVNVIGFNNVAE